MLEKISGRIIWKDLDAAGCVNNLVPVTVSQVYTTQHLTTHGLNT